MVLRRQRKLGRHTPMQRVEHSLTLKLVRQLKGRYSKAAIKSEIRSVALNHTDWGAHRIITAVANRLRERSRKTKRA